MGAWDHTNFGNDDACDWAGELHSHDDLTPVEETLDAVIERGSQSLDAAESSRAIAAAEVIARLQGRYGFRNDYTEAVDEWVEAHPLDVPAALARKALAALDRILTPPSELLRLWQDAGDLESWRDAVTELKDRIQ